MKVQVIQGRQWWHTPLIPAATLLRHRGWVVVVHAFNPTLERNINWGKTGTCSIFSLKISQRWELSSGWLLCFSDLSTWTPISVSVFLLFLLCSDPVADLLSEIKDGHICFCLCLFSLAKITCFRITGKIIGFYDHQWIWVDSGNYNQFSSRSLLFLIDLLRHKLMCWLNYLPTSW